MVIFCFSCSNSRIHVVNLINRATIDGKDIILVYGNAGELHETAFKFTGTTPTAKVLSGSGTIQQKVIAGGALALQFKTTGQTVVQVGTKSVLYILGDSYLYYVHIGGWLRQFQTVPMRTNSGSSTHLPLETFLSSAQTTLSL